jgi:hypothetical protein
MVDYYIGRGFSFSGNFMIQIASCHISEFEFSFIGRSYPEVTKVVPWKLPSRSPVYMKAKD